MINTLLVDQINSVTWKYTYSLANALKNRGINVTAVVDLTSEQGICQCDIVKVFNTADKNISKVNKLKNYIKGYKKILTIIKEKKIEILHLQYITFSPIDYNYIKKIKKYCKVILTIHDINNFDSHFYDKIYFKKIYNAVDSLIIQTENNIERFKKLFPEVNENKIHLAYHGHFLGFADVHDKNDARKHLGLPMDKFVFMFFGQIKKVKGVDLLIKAFSDVVKEYPDSYLLIAGKIWHSNQEYYEEVIKSNNIPTESIRTDIKFIPDNDIGYYFSACDIVCLPYTELYQSGVVQLSYAYKKPAIVSDLPAFLTVVKDDSMGYIFKTGDIGSLSEKMRKAIQNKENISYLSECCYEYIKEKYSWDTIADKISNIYEELLK